MPNSKLTAGSLLRGRYCTRIGNGPRHLSTSDQAKCLIDPSTGYPRPLTKAEVEGSSVKKSAPAAEDAAGSVGVAVAALSAQSAAQHREVLAGLQGSSWVEDAVKFAAMSALVYGAMTLVCGKCHKK